MIYDWYKNVEFANWWVLGFLLFIPVLIVWYWQNINKRNASMMVTTTHFIKNVRSIRTWFQHFPFVLRCLAIACIIIALARPQHKFSEQLTEGEGIDIVLCFDISGSMTEKDFAPNRLEASKEVAKQFVANRTGDRIGVVIFSRQSFTLCPITTDKNAVLAQINNIKSGYLEEEGTAIGSGLATSVDRLKDQKTKSRIIILLTDGVDFGGLIPPDIAKDMAKLYGIKVYTIGVGSEKEITVASQSPFDEAPTTKRLEFNEALLQSIATETGGQYFHATDMAALENIYASIDKLEKTKIEITTYDRFTEEFFPLIFIALALLFVEGVLRFTVFRRFP